MSSPTSFPLPICSCSFMAPWVRRMFLLVMFSTRLCPKRVRMDHVSKEETVVSLNSLSRGNTRGYFCEGLWILSVYSQGLGPRQDIWTSKQHKRGHNTNFCTQKPELTSFFIIFTLVNQIILFVFLFVPRLWAIFSFSEEIMLPIYSLVLKKMVLRQYSGRCS